MKSFFDSVFYCSLNVIDFFRLKSVQIITLLIIFCRHRVCNIFARTYYERWLQEEDIGQEALIEDLTVS